MTIRGRGKQTEWRTEWRKNEQILEAQYMLNIRRESLT